MSEENTQGDGQAGLTDQEGEGIFAAASAAAAKGDAPPAEEQIEKKADEGKAPEKKADEGKQAEAKTPEQEAEAARLAEKASQDEAAGKAAKAEKDSADRKAAADETARKASDASKNQKTIMDQAAEAVAAQEFIDPTGDKINGGDLEKEYPQVMGYTRALVAQALELQGKQLRAEFTQQMADRMDKDPTISRIRQAEAAEQVATLLESVATGEGGISNAAEIQAAAMKSDWVKTQSAHIQRMALDSMDPRDVRYVLERAAADLKIDVKRGESGKAAGKPAPHADNRVLAARSGLRGTGRGSPAADTGKELTPEQQEQEFERASKAVREGKPL